MDSDTKMTECKKSDSSDWGSHIGPENLKWLSKNLTGMDRSFNTMLKLIEEHGKSAVDDEMDCQNKTELVAGVHEFYRIYQSLAMRYDHLTQELQKDLSSEYQIQGSDYTVSPLTPRKKLDVHNSAALSISYSSGGGSSDLSPNAGTESHSSSDSESESFNSSVNNYLDSLVNTDKGVAELPCVKQDNGLVDEKNVLKFGEQRSYEELTERVARYKEELRILKLKLQLSEQEVERLQIVLKKGEYSIVLVENLRAQLQDAQNESKIVEAELVMERFRVSELQKQVVELESRFASSNSAVEKLTKELGEGRESLKASDEEIWKLRAELNPNEQSFSFEKVKLQSNITVLSEKQAILEARLQESESNNKSLEEKIKHYETERREVKTSYDAKECEFGVLKSDLAAKLEHIEMLNKDFDMHKLKYDMLMADKDGVNATVDKLRADLRSRDIEIKQMEDRLVQVHRENNNVVSESESARKHADGLRSRVHELKNQIERQRIEISEVEEEKKEAIRQLCVTLDHYKTGYRGLCQEFTAQKQHLVVA